MADEHFCATILLAERAELFGPFALARAAGVCTPAKDHVFDVTPIAGGNCGFQRSCGVLRSSAGSEIIFSENRLMRQPVQVMPITPWFVARVASQEARWEARGKHAKCPFSGLVVIHKRTTHGVPVGKARTCSPHCDTQVSR